MNKTLDNIIRMLDEIHQSFVKMELKLDSLIEKQEDLIEKINEEN